MIPEIGQYALILALAVAVVQAALPLVGAARNDVSMMDLGRNAAIAQFGFIAVAFACLMQSYVVSDFSVKTVADNSNSAMPLLYKIAGTWGNHEGSMVLWVFILSLFGASVAAFGRNLPPPLRARVLAVQAMIGVAFLAFIVFTSNPFLRLNPAPPDGSDLNPLLQDPGLAFHPPFLYLGYVGFSTTFSFAIAALIEGRVDPAWARWVRPWTLAAWAALTIGIAMGSWWSYYTLGWGGWWFWDPVENASFMPWLIGTALLHSAIVAEKRDALKSWTILLAILAFALSLIGTFLVRSGVLTSVHAFAVDPKRGVFILAILVVAIGGPLALYAWRAPMLKLGGVFAPISREGAMVLNNLLLATGCTTVFLGTLYPLFLDALNGSKVSVGPPFFDATFIPLMIPVAIAMAIAPLIAWKRGDLMGALSRLWIALLAAAAVAIGVMVAIHGASALAIFGMALAAWASVGAIVEVAERVRLFRVPVPDSLRRLFGLPRAAWGMAIAHFGIGVFIAGVTASSAWQVQKVQLVRPGDTVNVAGYDFKFEGAVQHQGPDYVEQRGAFIVTKDGRPVTVMHPSKKFYPVAGTAKTDAAIHTFWVADLYATISDPDEGQAEGGAPAFPNRPDGAWAARITYNPLVPFIWIGAVIMALGGVTSLTDRRHRVGAPVPARPRPSPAPAAAE